MSLQALKARSRLAVHQKMSRPASFYVAGWRTDPVTLNVRLHYTNERVGDLAGTNLSYAEKLEQPTSLIFWLQELVDAGLGLPSRGNVVLFSETEFFHVDVCGERDQHLMKAEVTPMRREDVTGKFLPDGTEIVAA